MWPTTSKFSSERTLGHSERPYNFDIKFLIFLPAYSSGHLLRGGDFCFFGGWQPLFFANVQKNTHYGAAMLAKTLAPPSGVG